MFLPLVSILINNYNHERFLGSAIDSALNQDYPRTEVVVVDDGSTDGSRGVIAGYGDRVVSVLKTNGGQASAFNAGVAASRGDILCFLDADDLFDAGKVTRVVRFFSDCGLVERPAMLHHLLRLRDENAADDEPRLFGRTHPSPLNLYEFAKRHRFLWYSGGPTSAIAVNRVLADRLFPIPDDKIRISADDFVVRGAFLIGEVYSLAEPLGVYRIHGENNHYGVYPRKTPEFNRALQDYLNSKLVASGLAPVIAFDESLCAWPALKEDKRWGQLAWRIVKTCVRDRDRYTMAFAGGVLADIARRIGDRAARSFAATLNRISLRGAPMGALERR